MVQENNTCYSYSTIINTGGLVNENPNGTVSVFLKQDSNYIPFKLNKICCENLKTGYVYDENAQTCIWSIESNESEINEPFKLTINTNNDDGTIVEFDSKMDCSLDVSFDYLINYKCEELHEVLTKTSNNPIINNYLSDITNIKIAINDKQNQIILLQNQITLLNESFTNTRYSINCDLFPVEDNSIQTTQTPISSTSSFGRTGFGIGPFSFAVLLESKNFCLTEPNGLNKWAEILDSRYQSFINGNANSYSCDDVITIYNLNDTDGNGEKIVYVEECNTPFGTKTIIQQELNGKLADLIAINGELTTLNNQLTATQELLNSFDYDGCLTPIDVLESLDISVNIEYINDLNQVVIISSNNFFPKLGNGGLYPYLQTNENSGLNICGISGITCSPIILSDLNPQINTSTCNDVKLSLLDSLFIDSGLPYTSSGLTEFKSTLYPDMFNSRWKTNSFSITDDSILATLNGKKVKLSLSINNSCSNICIYLDNISLNKTCKLVKNTELTIYESPSFEVKRIIDNKKSWVTTDTKREFSIDRLDNKNPIRQTNYDVNDDRLIINSKEIDLDLSISDGIVDDVYNFIKDNSCILSGETNCDICTETCAGDDKIDFLNLLTTSFNEINSIDDFYNLLSSELIDVKNRKVLSAYPTIKALYDRYINSELFCGIKSSKFTYLSMDQFAKLIGDYWIDIVEQVIPTTTIWSSTRVYGNTPFDQQKFKYKSYTSLFCGNPFKCYTLPNPINGTIGQCQELGLGVEVSFQTLDNINNTISNCDRICITQMSSGSEFIGKVKILDANNNVITDSILYADLEGYVERAAVCDITITSGSMTAFPIGGKAPYFFEWSNGEITQTATGLTDGSHSVIIRDSGCDEIEIEFDYEINLCAQKQFQDYQNFDFQDGDLYEFQAP